MKQYSKKNINLGFKAAIIVCYDSFNNSETYSMKSVHLRMKIVPSPDSDSEVFDLYLSENNSEWKCILRNCEKSFLKYLIRSIFKVTFKKAFL